MGNVFEMIKAGPKAAADLSASLRGLADAVDRGEIIDLIGAYVKDGNYCFLYSSPLTEGLILSTLLQSNCIQRMRS